jgi:hypothetical protein
MSHRNDEALTRAGQVTALVPQQQFARTGLAQRQQAILEHLNRGLRTAGPVCPELNALWLQLPADWSWVVVVPSQPGYSTADLARGLSQTGTRLSIYPVNFVEAGPLDIDTSTRLIAGLGISGAGGWPGSDEEQISSSSHAPPITKTVVALESPLSNPLALPVALAADGVVLCVRRGRDRLASVRETVQAVGPNRILCCALVD